MLGKERAVHYRKPDCLHMGAIVMVRNLNRRSLLDSANHRSPTNFLGYFHDVRYYAAMYECKTSIIDERKHKRLLKAAREFMERWRAESRGSRPYVRVQCFGGRGKVFIDDFHYHIDMKVPGDMVRRYRLLPCVKELLLRTKETPVPTPYGNLSLEGKAPYGQCFRVIIRPEGANGVLQSFYPI